MQKEFVILVDPEDREIGVMEKLRAHQEGLLHRAISVFVFNSKGELLLQRRAHEKYHSPGLWTNTCCSHPRPGETTVDAAHRRLNEEMGITCELKHSFSFVYRSEFENGLTEHEFDHVFVGIFDGEPKINSSEVAEWKLGQPEFILNDFTIHPESYTVWFKLVLERVMKMH